MAEKTGIEWCDHTFNIAWGCEKVSPGCKLCYAERDSTRYGYGLWGPRSSRRTFGPTHWAQPLAWHRRAMQDDKPRRVFCSSMCDIGEDHPTIEAEVAHLWPLIKSTPALDWLLLTKRAERFDDFLPDDWSMNRYPNVWLGVSVESPEYLWRVQRLLEIPAHVRFVSYEPALEPVDFSPYLGRFRVSWVIVGGESGALSRPFDVTWARDVVRQCETAGVPAFVKQLGSHVHERDIRKTSVWPRPWKWDDHDGAFCRRKITDKHGDPRAWPEDIRVREFP